MSLRLQFPVIVDFAAEMGELLDIRRYSTCTFSNQRNVVVLALDVFPWSVVVSYGMPCSGTVFRVYCAGVAVTAQLC